MKNRNLIKEESDLLIEIAKDLKQFIPVLNQLKSSYEALEIGTFTNEVFKHLILVGPTKFIDCYVKQLNDQLDKMGITNSIIRQNSIKNHDEVIENIKKAILEAKKFKPEIYSASRPKLTMKFISFQDGFMISKIDKEGILETHCRTYLENDDEIKIMESVENLNNMFNKYLEILEEAGISSFNKFLSMGNVLIINGEGRSEVNPYGIKHVATFSRKNKEYNAI